MATQLWEEVRKKLKAKDEDKRPPLSIVAHIEDGYELQDDILSRHEKDKTDGTASEDPMLKMLPKYVGEYKSGSEIVPLPIPNISIQEPEKDVANLQALMSAPVTCTIPLADLLKIRPNLWEKVMGFPKVGEFCTKHKIEPKDLQKKPNNKKRKPVPVPTHKVSSQSAKNEMGNTTLPVEFNDCKAMEILDIGARVSTATKSLWQKWGK